MPKIDIIVSLAIIGYCVIVITEIISAVPVGLVQADYDGQCILGASTTYNATNNTICVTSYGKSGSCGYCTFLTIFTCLYAAGYAAYATYALCVSMDNGTEMWVLPAMMACALFFVLKFISSIVLSIGFSQLCSSITSPDEISTCAVGETKAWCYQGEEVTGQYYYDYLTTAQAASWVCVLEWFLLEVLTILHYRRNRSLRSAGSSAFDAGGINTSDTAAVVENEVTSPGVSVINPNFEINENNFYK